MEEYVTLNDAAAVLEVSTTSLYNWRAQGLLAMSQPYGPRLNLVSRSELHRLLREKLDEVFNNLRRTPYGAEVLAEYLKQFASSLGKSEGGAGWIE